MKYKIFKIADDASFRRFYRIVLNGKNKIVIFSEKEKYKNLIAYSAVNRFLRNNKILAPKLYSIDYSKGSMVIEDFGDRHFSSLILRKKNKLVIYKKLVNLLIKIQKIKVKPRLKNGNNKSHLLKKYSTRYLHQESDLFFDWYLPLFLNKKTTNVVKKKAKNALSKIYKKIHFSNSYFVHRDFHLQNLMKVGNKIGVLDSQDALIGNPAYDLASLVDDVRIRTKKKLKKNIYNYYLSKNPEIKRNNSEEFLNDFNILSVQRCLKIIGIFSRLSQRDKKRKYLKYIPYTWKLIEMRMKSYFFSDLKKILNKHVPKNIRTKIIN